VSAGGAYEERSVRLLWGTRELPTRGPKPGLTLEAVVRAAMALADAEGLGAVSMRRVAEALGIGTMSLYTYVPGKAELLDLMMDTALTEGPPLPERLQGWRAQVEAMAHASLAVFRQRPWTLELSRRRHVPGPNEIAGEEALLAALDGIGLTHGEMVGVSLLIWGYVDGEASRSAAAAATQRRTGISDDQWWAERESLWTELARHQDEYPTIGRVYSTGGYEAIGEAFDFGLQRILDGIQVLVDARAREEAARGA
jgi:AcrR family transcriptional regulator